MKRIYLLMFGALSVGTLQAQQGVTLKKSIMEKNKFNIDKPITSSITPSKATVLWSNELDTPSEWILTNNSNPDADWELTSTWPTNLGTTGGFDAPLHASVANGYAVIDSDQYGENGTQDAYLEYDGVIDFSADPNVTLEFSTYHRRFTPATDQYFVEFSIDGGTTWEEVELMSNFGTNTTSDNPRIESVNVSSIIGGEATVQFRFRYVGAWGWFWSVDDVKFVEPEDYDLRTSTTGFYSGDMSSVATELADGVEYYMLPESQITSVNKFTAVVENIGALDQTNAMLSIDVLDNSNGTSLDLLQGMGSELLVGASDSLEVIDTYTYPGAGEYAYKYYSSPDQPDLNTTNDTVTTEPIMVGTTSYARDNGLATGIITNSADNAGSQFSVGNLFEFFGPFSISSVNVAIGNNEAYIGQNIYVIIYKYNTTDGTFDFQFDSQDYQIQSGDEGGFVTIPLVDINGGDGTVEAEAGDIFLVTVGHYGGEDEIGFLMAQQVEDISVFFYDAAGELGSFADMSAVMIRPSEENFVSVDEVAGANFNINVYPNPVQGEANVSFELENASDVAVSLTDMSGKVVFSENIANVAAGKNQLTIPTEGLSNGVYFYNFAAGNNIVTEKIVINK